MPTAGASRAAQDPEMPVLHGPRSGSAASHGPASPPPREYHRRVTSRPTTRTSRRRRVAAQAFPNRLLLTKRTSGTNGWMSLWGSNAHGEIAGCPPPTA